jgi:ferrous iron transport protein B
MLLQIALIGNPNTGKTTLFNNLTSTYAFVGNWSGVTIEKKVGLLSDKTGKIIDLPGIYSLNPLTKDESVVTDFLLTESFSHTLNIVDASQLKRNMHLTLQLMEFGKPVVIGMNMIDVANRRGITVNCQKLAKALKVPVIPIVARSGRGCQELNKHFVVPADMHGSFRIDYGPTLESAIETLIASFPQEMTLPKRWLALQYLEGNQSVGEFISEWVSVQILEPLYAQTERKLMSEQSVKGVHQYIHQVRQDYIDRLLSEFVTEKKTDLKTFTERIDAIVTHRFIGIPLFLLFLYLIFMVTFNWGGVFLSDALSLFLSDYFTKWVQYGLEALGANPFMQHLILDGIVAGVGGVLVFVPQILILFLFISLLEDSGYMARVAMVMDRIMEGIGLNGKAFIPLIIGFGCNVPGVMAARTLEHPKERILTILLAPMMSCSARLPVYALFVAVFFARFQALVVLSLYVLGILIAFIVAKLFSSTLLKGESSFFIVELPPYRIPQLKTLMRSTWEKGKGFVKKAGTIIFSGSVLIWFLSYAGPSGAAGGINASWLARIGDWIAPLLAPLGFGTWQASASLLAGFLAKEVVVATMNILYAGQVTAAFTPLTAYSFMVFILLYIPCLATTATIMKELASKKWVIVALVYSLVVAYTAAFIIYQVGRWIGLS